MSKHIKKLNDNFFGHFEKDNKLLDRIKKFRHRLTTTGEHMDWLLGMTIGEQDVKFGIVDEEILFSEILKINHSKYKKELEDLPVIVKGRYTHANTKFHSLLYILHLLLSGRIDSKDIVKDIQNVYFIIFFIRVSSKLTHDFKKKPSHALAKTVVESLPFRFIIKQKGSWQSVAEYAAEDFMNNRMKSGVSSSHYENTKKYSDDDEILDIITMMVTRLNQYISNQYSVMMDLVENDGVLSKTSTLIIEGEDGISLGSIDNAVTTTRRYLESSITLRSEFIMDKVVKYVIDIYGTEEKYLLMSLEYISDNYIGLDQHEKLISIPITHGLQYVRDNNIDINNIPKHFEEIVESFRGKIITGKGQSEDIAWVKTELIKHVKAATGRSSTNLIINVVISTLTYIFIRAILMNKITN